MDKVNHTETRLVDATEQVLRVVIPDRRIFSLRLPMHSRLLSVYTLGNLTYLDYAAPLNSKDDDWLNFHRIAAGDPWPRSAGHRMELIGSYVSAGRCFHVIKQADY